MTERVGVIKRVRDLAVGTAKIWADQQPSRRGGGVSLDFLLEIGTEEIPHWMIPGALAQLAKMDLLGATPQVDATPRRLVVRAEGLPERTPDSEQIVKGPPITAGDKAAEGFAKKQGADASALRKAGNYYELVKKRSRARACAIFWPNRLPAAILGIQWPKTMYWTDAAARASSVRFAGSSRCWAIR